MFQPALILDLVVMIPQFCFFSGAEVKKMLGWTAFFEEMPKSPDLQKEQMESCSPC